MTGTTDASNRPKWQGVAEAALEVLPIVLVLLAVYGLYPITPVPGGIDIPGPPEWGGFRDLLIEGPDAGQWATNMERMAAGDYQHIDPHRMPTWLVLTAALLNHGFGIVAAGHLVNRGMYVMCALGTYTVGRLAGGRMVGLVAAALALAHPHLQLCSQRFGIDAAVEASLPVALALGFLTAKRWWFGPITGFLIAWIAFIHHTALPYALPPLLAALLFGQPAWRRWAGLLLMLVGVAAGVWMVGQVFPIRSLEGIEMLLSEGARPGSTGNGNMAGPAVGDVIRANLSAKLPAMWAALSEQMMAWHLPDRTLYVLAGLGVIGPTALAPDKEGSRPMWRRFLGGLGPGLVILACLAPLPVLAAVEAPPRYANNLMPFVALLVARGGAMVVVGIERVVHWFWRSWPVGIGVSAAGLAAAALTVRQPWMDAYPNNNVDEDIVGFYLLGDALDDAFADGAKVACPVTEALFQAGLTGCNELRCPVTADETAIVACLDSMKSGCSTDGYVGYVLLPGRQMYDPAMGGRTAMDVFVAGRFTAEKNISFGRFSAAVYRIPVDQMP